MTGTVDGISRARVMIDLKRYDEAAALLARLSASDPGDATLWCLLSSAQLGMGRDREALAAASQAAAIAPEQEWPHRLACTAYLRLGAPAEAVRAARESARLAPHEWRTQSCLAQSALATRHPAGYLEADRAATAARQLAPNEPDVHFISGQVSFAQGDAAAARAHQERALALDPTHSGALNELGRISLRRFGTAKAAHHFVQAARSAPSESAYRRNVEVAVRGTVRLVIYVASVSCLLATYLAVAGPPMSRGLYLATLAGVAVFAAALIAVSVLRMPPETRPFFRERRVIAALAVGYAPIVAALAAAVLAPAGDLAGVMAPIFLLALAARFAASAILRPSRRGPG